MNRHDAGTIPESVAICPICGKGLRIEEMSEAFQNEDGDRWFPAQVSVTADGSPVDPNADYFVLRLDTDPAARAAAITYAREIFIKAPRLSVELRERVWKHSLEGGDLEGGDRHE